MSLSIAPSEAVAPSSDGLLSTGPVSRASRDITLDIPLVLRHAGRRRVRIRARLHCCGDAPVLVIAGGISADRRVLAEPGETDSGWWAELVGIDKAVDARRFRVLAIDWLGADGALDVAIDSSDQSDALAAVLDHLGVAHVSAFIGASYGAMVGLQFASRHGHRLQRLIAISGVHRPHPYASAWRALQRQVARLGRSGAGAGRALALARQWAMLSYRTPEEFTTRFAGPPVLVDGVLRCPAEDYLGHCGARYAARWSSTAFLRLSESIDLHRVEPESIRVPTTVVAVDEDQLVPLADAFELCERLGEYGVLRVLRSRYGHDAFLKEPQRIGRILRTALSECRAVSA